MACILGYFLLPLNLLYSNSVLISLNLKVRGIFFADQEQFQVQDYFEAQVHPLHLLPLVLPSLQVAATNLLTSSIGTVPPRGTYGTAVGLGRLASVYISCRVLLDMLGSALLFDR